MVTLPRTWCQGNGVSKGTEIDIWFGTILIVAPPGARALAEQLVAAAGGCL